jgi:hypothetical protein
MCHPSRERLCYSVDGTFAIRQLPYIKAQGSNFEICVYPNHSSAEQTFLLHMLVGSSSLLFVRGRMQIVRLA